MVNLDAKIIYTGPSPRGWHRLQLAAECLQRYAWTYEAPKSVEGTKSTSPALAKGSLIHLALAQHYARMRAKQQGTDPEEWCEPVRAVELISKLEKTEQYAQAAIDVYNVYKTVYPEDERRWKVVAIEDLLSTKIQDKYLLTGRIDLGYEDLGGRIWVVDHKCLPASTSVLTPEGPVTVGTLVEAAEDWTCGAWDEQRKMAVWSKALAPVDAGVQDVYSVKLADGTSEKYGYRHPILTEEGWKQAKDVKPGDWVAIAPPPTASAADISDDVLRVIGLALSDGGRIKRNSESYIITAHDPSVRAFLIGALDRVGDSWALHTHKGEAQGIRLHAGGRARALLQSMEIDRTLAHEKSIPSKLLSLTPAKVGVLLGALWEGDGAAYLGTPSKSGVRPVRIAFSSRSRKMAEGVRHLLLQLGIFSNVSESQVAGAPYFQTFVVGRHSKRRFLGLALSGYIDCPVVKAGGRQTRSGRELEPLVRVYEEFEKTEPKGEDTRKRYPGSGRSKNPEIEDGVRWVKVQSVLFVGQERCYDIEVPEHHTFLTGQCVVTHNTTSRLTSKHKEYYTISGQLLGYSHMAQKKYGDRYAGLKINLIQHGDNPKFERITLPRSPNLESRFEQIVVDIEESIERMQASGRDYDNWPKSTSELTCIHRYGSCSFIDQCRWGVGAKKAGNWSWGDQ